MINTTGGAISIKKVRSVRVENGVRTERELQGEELNEWIKRNVRIEDDKDDNTDL